MKKNLVAVITLATMGLIQTSVAEVIFEDFNVNEGRFGLQPSFSGSSTGEAATSTADRVETDGPLEGLGHQKLVFDWDGVASSIQIRHLSGGGSAGGASGQPANTAFTTSSGTDGWIGFFLKTLDPNWTAQLWIEGASVNHGTQKPIIADGLWHAYEWNLDDTTGGADGWGSGVIAGTATVADGSHTIDSIVFRNSSPQASSTLYLDFVALNEAGSITQLSQVPEPSTIGLGLIGGAGLAFGYIRRRAKK